MAAQILNGIEIAKNIRLKIAADVIKRTKIGLPSPTLAVILVGNNPASHIYVRNKNIALYREMIYERVWNEPYMGDTRTVDLHIQRLRKKLDLKDNIQSVYKVGYRLVE